MVTKPKSAWKPGQSGNPAGRKPGTGEVAKLRASIAKRVPELLTAMMEKALDGDVGAARLLLERAIAPLKAIEPAVVLDLNDADTLTSKAVAVLSAAAGGQLAPGQASQLITAIGQLARLTEIDELAARITALEQQNAEP